MRMPFRRPQLVRAGCRPDPESRDPKTAGDDQNGRPHTAGSRPAHAARVSRGGGLPGGSSSRPRTRRTRLDRGRHRARRADRDPGRAHGRVRARRRPGERHRDGREGRSGGGAGRARQGADTGRRQGREVRAVRASRSQPAGGPGRRGQEVPRRRPPARDADPSGPRADRGVDLRRQRHGIPRHRRQPADRRQRGRQGRDHVRQRRLEGDGGEHAALDRLPLRRGRSEQELHRHRPRQGAQDRVHRRPPRRVHVPLRDAADPAAHERGDDGHDGGQAARPRAGRPRAVADPGGVLPRAARQARRHGQDGGRHG